MNQEFRDWFARQVAANKYERDGQTHFSWMGFEDDIWDMCQEYRHRGMTEVADWASKRVLAEMAEKLDAMVGHECSTCGVVHDSERTKPLRTDSTEKP